MSIVRQLVKAKEKERQRKEREDARRNEVQAESESSHSRSVVNYDLLYGMDCAETNLGEVDFQFVQDEVQKAKEAPKRGKYVKYTDEERYRIGRHASENGNHNALLKFQKTHPKLNESTIRSIKRKYEKTLKKHGGVLPKKALPLEPQGRPLMLGGIDSMVQSYLKAIRSRGGHVSRLVAEATAEALIKAHPEMELGHIDIKETYWYRSLFQRMGFKRRAGTTAKVPISDDLKREIELTYLHEIVNTVEEFDIPPSLVINLDQTPSKYVPGSRSTLAKEGSKNVPIAGGSDKRMITLTFATTLSGVFLPMQIIYGGKTKQSFPRGIKFPSNFSISANPKHYSNEKEALKHLDEVIIPYIEAERKRLNRPNQVALIIMDVFKGQMTDPVIQRVSDSNSKLIKVPANFTYLYQPLDAQGGVNVFSKHFMKNKFTHWYTNQIVTELGAGNDVNQIDIKFKLTTLKPLHAKWLIELYNHLTSPDGKAVCLKGWVVTGITDAIDMTSANLPSLDPFADIDPLNIEPEKDPLTECMPAMSSIYVTQDNHDDDGDDEEYEGVENEQLFEDEYDESDDDDAVTE